MNNSSEYDPKKSSGVAKLGNFFKPGSRAPNPPGAPHEPAALRETLGSHTRQPARQLEAPDEGPDREASEEPGNPAIDNGTEASQAADAPLARAPARKARAAAPRPRRKASRSEADLPPSRQGKVQLTQWVDPIDKQRIDLIVALNLADNKADFIKKAIDLFIEKHGKLPI